MTATAAVERLQPYLRPNQVEQLIDERASIDNMLNAPEYIKNQIQDKGAMLRHARSIDKTLHENVATPYLDTERDRAARREKELLEDITAGMPTQAEMRRSPPGAVDKHRAWERDNKQKILEWKNLRIRMHVSGMLKDHETATDVANLERFRPVGGSQELNMDNALIGGKGIFLPNGPIAVTNVMSDEDREAMKQRDMELAATVVVATLKALNEQAQTAAAPAKGPSK